jgi:hypothetical protein
MNLSRVLEHQDFYKRDRHHTSTERCSPRLTKPALTYFVPLSLYPCSSLRTFTHPSRVACSWVKMPSSHRHIYPGDHDASRRLCAVMASIRSSPTAYLISCYHSSQLSHPHHHPRSSFLRRLPPVFLSSMSLLSFQNVLPHPIHPHPSRNDKSTLLIGDLSIR